MRYTNNANLPQPIYDAIVKDDYDKWEANISVTELINPIQIYYLRKKYKDQIIEDVSDKIFALMGTAMHNILEQADVSAVTEKRLFIEVNDWVVTGQFDRLCMISKDGGITGLLQDYKFCSVWENIYGLKPDRIKQLNMYAYLINQNGYKCSKLQIVQIFRDWQKSKAKYDPQYPQQQVAVIDVPLWSEEKQREYIHRRIELFQQAEKGIIPVCTDEERWYTGDRWAVMKKGNKTAKRVLNTIEEAKQWKEMNDKDGTMYLEYRPGEAKRCDSYCDCRDVCPQYNKKSEVA